jgi:hypothetical protein
MTHRRCSTARWKALAWFREHERDQNSVMGQKVPSRKMITALKQEGLLVAVPTRIKRHFKLELSPGGYALLLSKHKQFNGTRKATPSGSRPQRNKSPEPQAEADLGSGAPATSD